jgi:hypothetical protein
MEIITALDTSINKKLDKQGREISRKLSETTGNIEESLINIDTRIHRITEDVDAVKAQVKKQERAIPELVNNAVSGQMSGVLDRLQQLEQGRGPDAKEARRSAEYWEARQSLRLSPICGDIEEGVRSFVVDTLGLDAALLADLKRSSYRKVPSRPNDRIKDEVVVKFASTRDRDSVKAAGFKLAGKEHSMRLEIPAFLLGQHRTLNRAALKLREAKPGTKTYVKFEDDSMSLVLDYRLQNGTWSRIRPEQAKQAIPASAPAPISEATAEEFSDLLSPATGANTTPLS